MTATYGSKVEWEPARPRLRPLRLAVAWLVAATAVYVASAVVPGFTVEVTAGAFLVAAAIAIVNAVLPPIIACLRLPFTLVAGFILVLLCDAVALKLTSDAFAHTVHVAGLGEAVTSLSISIRRGFALSPG